MGRNGKLPVHLVEDLFDRIEGGYIRHIVGMRLVGTLMYGLQKAFGHYYGWDGAMVGGATGMTAVTMIFETTRDYDIVLPMILAVALSVGVRRLLSYENIYTPEALASGTRRTESLACQYVPGPTRTRGDGQGHGLRSGGNDLSRVSSPCPTTTVSCLSSQGTTFIVVGGRNVAGWLPMGRV